MPRIKISSVWGTNHFACRRTLTERTLLWKRPHLYEMKHTNKGVKCIKMDRYQGNHQLYQLYPIVYGVAVWPPHHDGFLEMGVLDCISHYERWMTILFLGKWPMFWSSQSWKRLMYWWHGALWRESKDQDAKCHKYIQWCSCFLIWQRTVIQKLRCHSWQLIWDAQTMSTKNTRSQNSLIFNCSARHVVCTRNQRQNWNRKTSKQNSNSFILRLHNVPTESRLLLTATIWRTPLNWRKDKESPALHCGSRHWGLCQLLFFLLLLHSRIKPRKTKTFASNHLDLCAKRLWTKHFLSPLPCNPWYVKGGDRMTGREATKFAMNLESRNT